VEAVVPHLRDHLERRALVEQHLRLLCPDGGELADVPARLAGDLDEGVAVGGGGEPFRDGGVLARAEKRRVAERPGLVDDVEDVLGQCRSPMTRDR